MARKMECPHCGEEILANATKCRHCFGDLAPDNSGGNKHQIVGMVLFLVIVVGSGIFGIRYVYGKPSLNSVTIDEGTNSIVMIWTQYGEPPETRRIAFEEIAKVEFVTGNNFAGGTYWSVFVVLNDDDKVRINHSTEDNLKGYAETVSAKTGAPYVPINKARSGRGLFGPGS